MAAAPDDAKPVEPAPAPRHRFAIVGLGASAGGLEALDQFLRATPPDSGLCFVVVQHLDPSHPSILSEILQRSTAMPVVEVHDQMAVAPDHVYIIPPNRDMGIFHGRLQLSEPAEPRGQRLPIDAFFRSLAEDQGDGAMGVVLSGSGSDGTLGLRAIFGAGGLCLVQDPTTAQYASMPASAIAAGYANQVLPVERMPAALRKAAQALPGRGPSGQPVPPAGLARILTLLRLGCGHDFSQYKPSTVNRRIERRMALHGIDDAEVYARHLKQHPAELQTLFREMLINVTSFFRDPQAFAALKSDVLRDLLAAKSDVDTLRIWVAGCATGEEAYSIAILLRELLDDLQLDLKVQLYSTDLDEDAIAVARVGLYPTNIAQDLTPERLRRHFSREPDGYRVKKEIREMVVFAVQSVTRDPPFTRLDLLACRNLLIYLQPELQDRLIRTFHYVLKPGGVLMLSPSESVGRHTDLFEPISRKWKLYRALPVAGAGRSLPGSGHAWTVGSGSDQALAPRGRPREQHIADVARRALLQAYAPASVVTDLQGDLLYVHGETGRYLRPAPGQPTRSLVEMARDGLQLELREALVQARQGVPVLGRPLQLQLDGHLQPLRLSVRPLSEAGEPLNLLLVSFQDQPEGLPPRRLRKPRGGPSAQAQAQAQLELERELAFARQSMSALVEEQQLSNEELKSTNEELQSTNEELQSTNEEMETSREELQSVNEELVTVNSELQVKIEQMADMQDDMKNLLDNIRVGTIFLDRQLKIRRFTRDATRVFRLVATDVGRALADIRSDLQGDGLLADAQTVLETLAPIEREVCTAAGTWYLARIQPYRTVDDLIDGVVLTFTDVTERVHALAARKALALAEAIVDALREPLLVLDAQLQVLSANRAFCSRYGVPREAAVGRRVFHIGQGGWDVPALHALLETRLPRERAFERQPLDLALPAPGPQRLWLSARPIAEPDAASPNWLLVVEADGAHPGAPP
ncbi:MAG: chemotaxis protein CheB [Aquabacterium sp.]|nr:chemotaxis protein CheB [Aquabacterium sp.]